MTAAGLAFLFLLALVSGLPPALLGWLTERVRQRLRRLTPPS